MTNKSIFGAALTAFVAVVGPGGAAHADPPTQVMYRLTGSTPVADYVSYELDRDQRQETHVALPWQTRFTVGESRVFVISAQSPGSITCSILVDGKVVSQATAHGAPARTVCSN